MLSYSEQENWDMSTETLLECERMTRMKITFNYKYLLCGGKDGLQSQ